MPYRNPFHAAPRPAALVLALGLLPAACGDQGLVVDPRGSDVPADRNVSWSPDGQWLAFDHSDPSAPYPDIYVQHVNGSGRRRVAIGGFAPTWSPDGLTLVYHNDNQVYKVFVANDSAVRLTNSDRNADPAWSPDGQRIVYSSDRQDPAQVAHLWLMNADGGGRRRIPGGRPLGGPRWSPDGLHVVAHGSRSGDTLMTVFVTDTLGGDTLQLTSQDAAQYPAWSPDGAWIAYTRMTSPQQIRAVRPTGADDRLVVTGGFQPAWSPDGSRIAFSRRTPNDIAIWVVNSDGSNLARLTTP